MKFDFNNKTVLITGGSGSWGNELTKHLLLKYEKINQIKIFSRGELAQVNMKRYFDNWDFKLSKKIKYIIGDIRDFESILEHTQDVNIIFHLAALKHIPICEEHPLESIKTNIIGVENIIKVTSINKNISLVCDVSTDKACNPINTYGICKSLGEKLIINANLSNISSNSKCKFFCIRAGNVMGTNGSIIPYFIELSKNSESIPITDIKMTRYFMKISEAINLILMACSEYYGGEIFVTTMHSMKIIDLATVIWNYYNPKINFKYNNIGIRQGEKLHEYLVSEYEKERTYIKNEELKIILPYDDLLLEKNFKNQIKKWDKMKAPFYSSNNQILLSKKQIKKLLIEGGFFNEQ